MIRLVIVSDILLYREGVAALLAREPGLAVLATAANGSSAVSAVVELVPDLVLLDMAMPECASTAVSLVDAAPGVRLVGLAAAEGQSHLMACAEAGIVGFVPREASLSDLVSVLGSVIVGQSPLPPGMASSLMRELAVAAAQRRQGVVLQRLTLRERQVLGLIDQGYSNKEIARRLGIQISTVKNHVHSILDKLQLRRRFHAASLMRGQFPLPSSP